MPKMQYGTQEHAIMLSAACLQHRSPDSSRVLVESLQQDNLKKQADAPESLAELSKHKGLTKTQQWRCNALSLSTTLLKPRAFDQKQNAPRTA